MWSLGNEVGVLLISAFETDCTAVKTVLENSLWKLEWVRTYAHGTQALDANRIGLVICERDLPDGTWKDVFAVVTPMARPPLFVVASAHADNRLWAEVLNLGGFDVLAKPFETKELTWSLTVAWDHLRSRSFSSANRAAGHAASAAAGVSRKRYRL